MDGSIDMVTGGADGVGIIQDSIINKTTVAKEPGFLKNLFDGVSNQDYGKIGNTIKDGVKKFGKAMFTNKDGSIDKAAVMGAITFAASYAEARALAADAGIDLTEEEYDESLRDEKKAEYAGYLTNFFGGKKDGGRIGFDSGANEMIKTQLLEEIMPNTDTTTEDFIIIMTEEGPIRVKKSDYEAMPGMFRDTTTSAYGDAGRERPVPEFADGGRVSRKFGSPEKGESEIGIMSIDVEAGDDEDEEDMMMAGITFSSAEKSYLFRKLGGAGGSDRSFTMPQLYRVLSNPDRYAEDAAVLKEIAIMGLGKKDGGRIGYKDGTDENLVGIETLKLGEYDLEGFQKKGRGNTLMFGSDDLKILSQALDYGELSDLPARQKEKIKESILRARAGIINPTELNNEIGMLRLEPDAAAFLKAITPDETMEKVFFDKEGDARIGVQKARKLMEDVAFGGQKNPTLSSDMYNKLGDEYIKDQKKDIQRRIDFNKEYGDANFLNFKDGGLMNLGGKEMDMRGGGFIPIGKKERADDVPARLSKNEFVMTADAVRAAGGGSVNEGAKRMYETMNRLEARA